MPYLLALLAVFFALPASAKLVYHVHFDGPIAEDPRGGDCRQLHHVTDSLPRCADVPPCLEEDPANCPAVECTRHDRAAYHTTWDVVSCGETRFPSPQGGGYAEFACTGDGVMDYIAKFDLADVWLRLRFYGDPSNRMSERAFLELHSAGGSAMNCNDPVPGLIWAPDPVNDRVQFDIQTCGDVKLPPNPTEVDRTQYLADLVNYRKRLAQLPTERPAPRQWVELMWHFNPSTGDSELWLPGSDFNARCGSTDCIAAAGRPARGQTPNTVQGFLLRDVAGCDVMLIDDLRIYDARPL